MHKKQNKMKSFKLILLCGITLLVNFGCGEKAKESEIETASSKREESLSSSGSLSTRTEIYSPERQLSGFKVPEGFIVELVASEEDGVINPIDLTFDDAGRLWTQTAKMYPLDPIVDQYVNRDGVLAMEDVQRQKEDANFKRVMDLYRGKTKGDDKILVLSNLYGKKNLEVTTWADGLAIPQSILPYKDGAFVAQGSEMFFLNDADNDGKSDIRTPLLTGFGFTDTHTMSHTLVRAPGEWIHFSHGALNKGEVTSLTGDGEVLMNYSKIARFSLDAKKIELVNAGLNNIWGFQLRGNGQWYGTEANDLGYSVVPMEVGTGFPGIGNERLRPYQPWMPQLHEFRVGGTGISSMAFADDNKGSFPDEWKDVAFLANPITSTINAVRIVRNSDGTVAAEHLPDFLTSKDDWFRPVNMEFGPDGSLYVADWYNKIVSHNEVATSDPSRDKSHGRIWRIRHESQQSRKIPNFYEVQTDELVGYLESPSLWAKRAAWHQISDRPIEETKKLAGDLIALAGDASKDEITRILALWSLEGIKHYDKKFIYALLRSDKDNLRRETVRSLASFSLNADEMANALRGLTDDTNAMVRSQVLRTLGEAGTANAETIGILVGASKPLLEGNAMGGAYERNFERYLARKTLEDYPEELSDFISSEKANEYDTSNLIWASQALPKQEREQVFINLWKKAGYKELDEPTFIIIAGMLENKNIYNAMRPILEQNEKAEKHVSLALNNLAQTQSDALTQLLVKPVRYLLQGKESKQQHLGLEAVGKLKIHSLRDAIVPLIKEDISEETMKLVMGALQDLPVENKGVFAQIAKNQIWSLELRATAIRTLANADLSGADKILSDWIPKLQETDQKTVVKIVSNSKEGGTLLKGLLGKGLITSQAFDISSAEKVYQSDEGDVKGKKLFDEVKQRMEGEKKAFEAKLDKFMAIAEKESGNPSNGEKLFQACLLCHRVGSKGYDFAPALDGSALRENEALLTAILNPDAAMESSYAIYRVTKKDGSTIEGYLVKKDERGSTIGFMGGNTQFVQTSNISSQGFLGGRSFMPKGLIDNYSDEQVSDLVAYIRTLK